MSQRTRSEDGDSHPSRHAQWRQIRPYRRGLRAAYRDVVCYVCRSSYLICHVILITATPLIFMSRPTLDITLALLLITGTYLYPVSALSLKSILQMFPSNSVLSRKLALKARIDVRAWILLKI